MAATRRRWMTRYAESIGPARRAQDVTRATESYLRAHKLVDATFQVTDDGYGVEISIPPADLCSEVGAVAVQPGFAAGLRDALGFLSQVTVRVAGRDVEARSYVTRHCTRVRRVYQKAGSGPFTSPTFVPRRGRWTVLLSTVEGGAQLTVSRGGEAPRTDVSLTLTERGLTGRQIRGRTPFRLRVRGSGKWLVAVLRSAL